MRSRGSMYSLPAGARKSLVLLWTAVLLCSLMLQYVAAATPAPVLALNASLFELDGNTSNGADPGDGLERSLRRQRWLRQDLHQRSDQRRRRQVLRRWLHEGRHRHLELALDHGQPAPGQERHRPRVRRRLPRGRRPDRVRRPGPVRLQRRRAGRLLVPPERLRPDRPERHQRRVRRQPCRRRRPCPDRLRERRRQPGIPRLQVDRGRAQPRRGRRILRDGAEQRDPVRHRQYGHHQSRRGPSTTSSPPARTTTSPPAALSRPAST